MISMQQFKPAVLLIVAQGFLYAGCKVDALSLSGKSCDAVGQCAVGFVCHPTDNTCIEIDPTDPATVTQGDTCGIEGSFIPCQTGGDPQCADGCIYCTNGAWTSCQGGTTTCTPNTTTCNGDTLVTCDAAGLSTSQNCPLGCDSTAMKCNICSPGATTCNGNTLETCDAAGQIQSSTDCGTFGCNPSTSLCNVCTPSEITCTSSTLNTCRADGKTTTPTACPTADACNTGLCDTNTNACGVKADTTDCGICQICNGTGSCIEDLTQDADCTTECQECAAGGGSCAPVADNTPCNDCQAGAGNCGVCQAGTCLNAPTGCTGTDTVKISITPSCDAGTTNVTVMHLTVTSTGCDNTLTGLILTQHAKSNSTTADVNNFEIYRDSGGTTAGIWDDTDTLVANAVSMTGVAGATGSGTITWAANDFVTTTTTPQPNALQAGTAIDLLIVADQANTNSYFAAQITNAAAVTVGDEGTTAPVTLTPSAPLIGGTSSFVAGRLCTGTTGTGTNTVIKSTDLGIGSQAATSAQSFKGPGKNNNWNAGAGDESGWTKSGLFTSADLADCDLETEAKGKLVMQDKGQKSEFLHINTGVPLGLPLCSLTMRVYASDFDGSPCQKKQTFTDFAEIYLYSYNNTTTVGATPLVQHQIPTTTTTTTTTSSSQNACTTDYIDIDLLSMYKTTTSSVTPKPTFEVRFIPETKAGKIAVSNGGIISTAAEIYLLAGP